MDQPPDRLPEACILTDSYCICGFPMWRGEALDMKTQFPYLHQHCGTCGRPWWLSSCNTIMYSCARKECHKKPFAECKSCFNEKFVGVGGPQRRPADDHELQSKYLVTRYWSKLSDDFCNTIREDVSVCTDSDNI